MVARNKLPRSCTLKSRLDIRRLFDTARRWPGDYFICYRERSKYFRYGVFVPGKILTAVGRNRLKRLTREAIRLNKEILTRPCTVGILFRRDVKELTFEIVDAEIKRVFRLINEADE